MLGQRWRRWLNIKATLGQRLVFVGLFMFLYCLTISPSSRVAMRGNLGYGGKININVKIAYNIPFRISEYNLNKILIDYKTVIVVKNVKDFHVQCKERAARGPARNYILLFTKINSNFNATGSLCTAQCIKQGFSKLNASHMSMISVLGCFLLHFYVERSFRLPAKRIQGHGLELN